MSNAKDFPNTVEFAAEKYYNALIDQINNSNENPVQFTPYSELTEHDKEDYKFAVITILEAVNFSSDYGDDLR